MDREPQYSFSPDTIPFNKCQTRLSQPLLQDCETLRKLKLRFTEERIAGRLSQPLSSPDKVFSQRVALVDEIFGNHEAYTTSGVVELGTEEGFAMAEQPINELFGWQPINELFAKAEGGEVREQFVMRIPDNEFGLVIGRGGETIKSIQSRSGARFKTSIHSDTDTATERLVKIFGTAEQIESAKQLINEVISQVPLSSPDKILTKREIPRAIVDEIFGKHEAYSSGVVELGTDQEQIAKFQQTVSQLIAKAEASKEELLKKEELLQTQSPATGKFFSTLIALKNRNTKPFESLQAKLASKPFESLQAKLASVRSQKLLLRNRLGCLDAEEEELEMLIDENDWELL